MPRQTIRSFVWRWALATSALVGANTALGAECSEQTARLVARAYVVASPIAFEEDAFVAFLSQNKDSFGKNGRAIRCMKAVGQKLLQGALANAGGPRRDYATERWGGSMPPGLEHLPGQVDANMRSGATDTFTMAQELLWLADVLPAAAGGNLEPFEAQNTLGRQMWQQALPLFQMSCSMDPGSCQVALALLRDMLASAEQQLYALAVQVGR